mmetsp:Transcript_48987/g.86275  ORF Transcript_48987/g.86275 Transcript_48987/m.86275 type:complete len:149 (-) Transcript_48987:43-489(-)
MAASSLGDGGTLQRATAVGVDWVTGLAEAVGLPPGPPLDRPSVAAEAMEKASVAVVRLPQVEMPSVAVVRLPPEAKPSVTTARPPPVVRSVKEGVAVGRLTMGGDPMDRRVTSVWLPAPPGPSVVNVQLAMGGEPVVRLVDIPGGGPR